MKSGSESVVFLVCFFLIFFKKNFLIDFDLGNFDTVGFLSETAI